MSKSIYHYFCILSGLFLLLTACEKQYAGIDELDAQNVSSYIQKNSLTGFTQTSSGIYYKVIQQGTGANLDYTVKIPLIYTVKTLDGTYSSLDTFNNHYGDYFGYFAPDSLREVIKKGLVKQGGSIRIIIPSRFAFGKNGSGSIPGNSSLDYTFTAITADKLKDYDDFVISSYLQKNSLTGFNKTASGLYYKIADAGSGSAAIGDNSYLTLEYTGKMLNGFVFDKTATGSTAILQLGGLIQGWREALPLIKKGGSIRIIVPSHLGYGLSGQNTIPPFSCLDFDIKVTEVTN